MLRLGEFHKAGMSTSAEERWVSGSSGNKLFTVCLLGTSGLSLVLNTALICSKLHQPSRRLVLLMALWLASASPPSFSHDLTGLSCVLLPPSHLSCDRGKAGGTWLIGGTSQTYVVPLRSSPPTEQAGPTCGTTYS